MNDFSHINSKGDIQMVDVSDKFATFRVAKAEGVISIQPSTLNMLLDDSLPKGNVLTTAKLAGIQAAKKASELIPLCHQINLSFIDLEFLPEKDHIKIISTVKTKEATGVEMEALTAVSIAALTIYDMCKAVDKTMRISEIQLIEKRGGKSNVKTDYKPEVGIITISDSVSTGKYKDESGVILKNGFEKVGCNVDKYKVLPDGSDDLKAGILKWIDEGVELVITTGGTGLGPRDLTIPIIEKIVESRLHGIEQALHAYGRGKTQTAMLSRLLVGKIKNSIVICLPGSPGAVRDALVVLIPSIFHAYSMMQGEGH